MARVHQASVAICNTFTHPFSEPDPSLATSSGHGTLTVLVRPSQSTLNIGPQQKTTSVGGVFVPSRWGESDALVIANGRFLRC